MGNDEIRVPDRVYLQFGDLVMDENVVVRLREIAVATWCADRINPTDIEYVRALPTAYGERIRSAAVRKAGVVYPCWAHTYHEITRLNLDAPEDVLKGEDSEQGFVTTRGRFVDRYAAMLIAIDAGQLVHAHAPAHGLFSEDLRPAPPSTEPVKPEEGK